MGIGMMRRYHKQKPQEVVVPIVETPEKPTPTPPTPKKKPGRPKKQAEEVAKDE